MHAVLVSHGYRPLPPEPADSPSVVIDALGRALTRRGLRITVVSGRSPRASRPYELVEIAPPEIIGRRSQKLAEVSFAADARRVVASIGGDIVQYHAPAPAALAAKSPRYPVVLEWSAPISSSGRVPTMGRLSTVSSFTEAVACRRADTVVVKSELSAAYVRRVYRVPSDRLAVIPNGVDVGRFAPPAKEPHRPTILNVARIARYKDQTTLVRAIARKSLRDRDARLLIAGPVEDQSYAAMLMRLARREGVERRVQLLGPIDVDQLPDLYGSAAVVACASLAEGAVPLALLEAMSAGRAIVASAIPQHMEVGLGSGVAFVPPSDPDATAQALADLLDDDEKRLDAGLIARRVAEERFSWDTVAERFEAIYRDVVHERSEPRRVQRRRLPIRVSDGKGRRSRSRQPHPNARTQDRLKTLDALADSGVLYDTWDDAPWGAHETVLRAVGSPSSVLDVGCATGNLAIRLLARGIPVVGVEPDANAAAVARSRRVDVVVGVFDRSTIEGVGGRRFGTIVFADSLEHMADPFDALLTARDLLADHGQVVVSIPNIVVWHARGQIALGYFDYRPIGIFDRTHLRFFTLKTARRLVEKAGFQVERIDPTRVALPVGPRWLRALWDEAYGRLARVAPGLLAEQFVIVCRPKPKPTIGRWP
jgi:glycosyltransferase involved in cell wall biosynthesis/2-polyprenyl-3-methyl-5-hydroxy-6-metoxy-1,4-benzoquinol methylase